MQLLPPAEGTCPVCAVDHPSHAPHNALSLYYQYRFFAQHGRWPTWADAIAHCPPQIQALWKQQLQQRNAWSEPEEGEPFADPPAESLRMAIGSPETSELKEEDH